MMHNIEQLILNDVIKGKISKGSPLSSKPSHSYRCGNYKDYTKVICAMFLRPSFLISEVLIYTKHGKMFIQTSQTQRSYWTWGCTVLDLSITWLNDHQASSKGGKLLNVNTLLGTNPKISSYMILH